MTTWSPQQNAAMATIGKWLKGRNKDRQVFRLFGYAGTGKTTLARHIAQEANRKVVFGAFTGKAASVMRSKGCHGASTIHSLIYTLKDEAKGIPKFRLNQNSPVKHADLCIIDECSMVDESVGKDLLSFGTPILVLGDPEQLPPIDGTGFFTNSEPDFMLSEVHRQARDNPIIRMSMDIREGKALHHTTEGACRVISRREIDATQVMGADQVLVGRNITRRLYNRRIRELRGFPTKLLINDGYISEMPDVGERLVCLKNNRFHGLLNGSLWTVSKIREYSALGITMIINPEDAGGIKKGIQVTVRKEFFEGRENEIPWEERRYSDEFDYGYALTVHKAQGSQWDNVVLFDESACFREDRRRWLYTGLTRAAKQITLVTA
jgi:exodeoxyribonuclease-5